MNFSSCDDRVSKLVDRVVRTADDVLILAILLVAIIGREKDATLR